MPPKAFGGPKICGGSVLHIFSRVIPWGVDIFIHLCDKTDWLDKRTDQHNGSYNIYFCENTFSSLFSSFCMSFKFCELMVVMGWEFDTDQLQVCRYHLLSIGIWDHIFKSVVWFLSNFHYDFRYELIYCSVMILETN